MQINRISASSYSTFDQCKWKYFLNQICAIPDISGGAALLGTISHHVLQILGMLSMLKHDKKSKYWDAEYLWKICYARYYRQNTEILNKVKKDKLKAVYQGTIELAKGIYSPITDKTIATEMPFKMELKEKRFRLPNNDYLCITGRIDRVDKLDEQTIEVFDYKSGSRAEFMSADKTKKNSEALRETIQAQMYYLAARELFPWAKNILVNFIYFCDGGSICASFSESDIPVIKNKLEQRLKDVLGNNDPQKTVTWACKTLCHYGKSGICQSVWKEKEECGFKFVELKYAFLKKNKDKK